MDFWSTDVCNSTLWKGCLFPNFSKKIMIFILDIQYFVPTKLCKTTGSMNLFKLTGTLKPENVKLN